jgi:hypothetical protein
MYPLIALYMINGLILDMAISDILAKNYQKVTFNSCVWCLEAHIGPINILGVYSLTLIMSPLLIEHLDIVTLKFETDFLSVKLPRYYPHQCHHPW